MADVDHTRGGRALDRCGHGHQERQLRVCHYWCRPYRHHRRFRVEIHRTERRGRTKGAVGAFLIKGERAMKKYQRGFIGWMIPAIYGILATIGGIYMVQSGNVFEKVIGIAILVIAIITFWKMKKHIFPKKDNNHNN